MINPADLKPGDPVFAFVGTKAGHGIVARVYDDHKYVLVDFPDAEYPNTVTIPTGSYLIQPDKLYHPTDDKHTP